MVKKILSSPLKVFCFSAILFCASFIPVSASALSDLYLSPASGSFVIGREFTVSILVNTNGSNINTVVSNLTFDKSLFAVTDLDVKDFTNCPDFKFNETGQINLGCGSPISGVEGGAGKIAIIHLKGIAIGTGRIDFDSDPPPEIYLNELIGDDPASKQGNQIDQTTGGEYTIIPEPLSATCSASPSSTAVEQKVNFMANASGGTGGYTYSWSGACQGNSATCEKSFPTSGNKTAVLAVTSGVETATAECSVAIGLPGLNVSCYSSKETANTGESVLFSATASGGSGAYTYSWSGDCKQPNNLPDCANKFDTPGLKKTTVSVTSGDKASSANCTVYINEVCPVQPNTSHTICHNQKCEYIFGEGADECRQDTDCGFIIDISQPIETIKKIINTPIGSVATKTASLVALIAATTFASPIALPELFMLPTRLLGLLLLAFGLKKRNPPWGVVYDSITKQPLDPAYVTLKDMSGKDISSAITDLDGRYGFLTEPGSYKMAANKTNYLFPSQKLAGKTSDELYNNLYFGEQIEIKRGEIVRKNIPLDPLKFDWNEYSKQKKKLTKFYSSWDMLLRQFTDVVYFIGFIIATIAFFAAPYPYNTIIFGLYVFLLILRIFGIKPRPYGSVRDKNNNNPVAFAILRVMEPDTNKELSHKVTDRYGRYFCLIPKGRYYIKIENKNADGSYSLAHTSGVIDASKTGIIKERFKIIPQENGETASQDQSRDHNSQNTNLNEL
jgi:hypothetical protein